MTLAFGSLHWLKRTLLHAACIPFYENFLAFYGLKMLSLRLLPTYDLENDIMEIQMRE